MALHLRNHPSVAGIVTKLGDHFHPEYWEETDQHRFEDRVSQELHAIRGEVRSLRQTVTMLMGAIAVLAFILPIAAPFIRSLMGIP